MNGVVTPETPKSLAFTDIRETVTLLLPVLVIVTFLELVPPALTLPNDRLVGLAESVTVAATPVPVNATAFGEFGALLVRLTLPVRLPAVVGANTTLNVAVPPAVIVAGAFKPLTLYPVPLAEIREMVSAAVPVFVTVKLCDLVWPSMTFPKLNVEGEIESPACTPVPLMGIVKVELLALLAIVIDPEPLPVAVGAYVAVNVAVAEGFKVAGVVKPVTV